MDKQAYSIDEFCFAHGFCRASFYNLLKRGEGPRVMKVGGRTLVSQEAATEWRREREGVRDPKAA